MTDPSSHRPTSRFTGLAELYSRCRPGYPEAAIEFVMERCELGPEALLVDVGCGTGISSRIFAGRGVPVIGIEPNADMRCQAELEPLQEGTRAPEFRDGQAEATGLGDSCADAVLAAQAFHWFRSDDALREFHRILKPGGWTVLIWNERDASDPFTAAYGEVIRSLPDAIAVEIPRGQAGNILLTCPLFGESEKVHFTHEQSVDEAGLIGRALSASYAPREESISRFEAALHEVFERFQRAGLVTIRYETTLYLGRRKG